jgi:hypothetical protein
MVCVSRVDRMSARTHEIFVSAGTLGIKRPLKKLPRLRSLRWFKPFDALPG